MPQMHRRQLNGFLQKPLVCIQTETLQVECKDSRVLTRQNVISAPAADSSGGRVGRRRGRVGVEGGGGGGGGGAGILGRGFPNGRGD